MQQTGISFNQRQHTQRIHENIHFKIQKTA